MSSQSAILYNAPIKSAVEHSNSDSVGYIKRLSGTSYQCK